jgi:hypothetical protein
MTQALCYSGSPKKINMPRKDPANRGPIAPAVEAFVSNFLLEVGPTELNIDELLSCFTCPPIKAALETIVLMGVSYFGEYTHPKEKIQKYIRSNFERMDGAYKVAIAQSFISMWLGYSCHEISHKAEGKDWMLQSLLFLNPKRWAFRGTIAKIQDLHYYGAVGDLCIPYDKVLHIVGSPHLTLDNSPYGFAQLKSAIAPYRAWKILVAQMMAAGSRQANGLLVGYVDPSGATEALLDENGQPIIGPDNQPIMVNPAEDMGKELAGIDGRSYIVTSTANKIESLKIEPDIDFYLGALKYCHKLMYLSLMFPETMLELVGGGSGDSNLHEGQASLLGQWVEQQADQIKEQMLERVVRQLITWKFGEQDDWGSFPVPEQAEEQRVELLNAIVSAMVQQVFSADDLDIINKARMLIGVPELNEIIAPVVPEGGDPFAEVPALEGDAPVDDPFAEADAQAQLAVGDDYWKLFEKNGHALVG